MKKIIIQAARRRILWNWKIQKRIPTGIYKLPKR